MDVLAYNKEAWNQKVRERNVWTIPVSADTIARARRGDWFIIVTPRKPVPSDWFSGLTGKKVLCLAGGGGQQGPILAAAGFDVTVFDNSPKQLENDRVVARRESLSIATVEGDMADLSALSSNTFDLIVHPCSNCFSEHVEPVWRECARVMKKGGSLLSGFTNPVVLSIDPVQEENGVLQLKYRIPYSDLTSLPPAQRQALVDKKEPMVFGHSLTQQIGGQIEAGFSIRGFFEDTWDESPLHDVMDAYIATRAIKD